MIPIEKQVASLELAKRLKELGVKQESLFFWQSYVNDGDTDWSKVIHYGNSTENLSKNQRYCLADEWFSAFTVAELGEMLPSSYQAGFIYSCRSIVGKWTMYCRSGMGKEKAIAEADTEANVRAKMLIFLLENKLITL